MNNLLSPSTIDDLALRILEHYEDGKYAYDDTTTAQSQNHRTHKSYIKKALNTMFNETQNQSAVKYLKALADAWNEGNPTALRVMKNELAKAKKQIKKVEHDRDHPENRVACAICHTDIIKARDEARKKAMDELPVFQKCEDLKQQVSKLSKERLHYSKLVSEQKRQHTEEYNQLNSEFIQYKAMVESSGQPSKKESDSKYKRKYKQLQKEFEAYKKKNPEVDNDATSSSSEEDLF